jgi:hypothetical protein
MPDMTGQKWEEFKKDIQENGVKVPVLLDENNNIIDGHQRLRACDELGIPCPTDKRDGLTEDEKQALVMSLNYHRRQLTPQQQHEVSKAAAENYKRRKAAGEDVTQAQVAKEFGIHRNRISENVNALPVQNPKTPTEKPDTGIQQKSEPSAKKIIVDIYPQKGGKRGYQIKITDGTCFIKQSKDLELCEVIKNAINAEEFLQDSNGITAAKGLANDILNQKPVSKSKSAAKQANISKPTPVSGDVDFSFLLEKPSEIEPDTELDEAFSKMVAEADLMAEFKNAICVSVVAEFFMKSLKEKLSQYPDTLDNSCNGDRTAFVNVFNILKKIIRKEG